MKNTYTLKNIDSLRETPSGQGNKGNDRQIGSPIKIDLKLKILSHSNSSNATHFRTKENESKSKEKEQESTELLLTERTNGINQFMLSAKQSFPNIKGLNIKSYLRIKPNKTSSSSPLEIYHNRTIICDRTVYKFDFIFQPYTPQTTVYEVVGKEVTSQFMEGYNGTIFAYGSTGSGKTFTMFGNQDGLVPSVVEEIFSKLDSSSKLSCSMIEIYKQNLIDLLAYGNEMELKIKEVQNNYTIQNLSLHQVGTREDTLRLIQKGNNLKKIRETNLNQSSSRSHIVFTFYLERVDQQGKSIKCKFNLVDLAGSEKVFKSKVEGEGLEEAIKINLSLSCLGNTISALVRNSDHIPYRQSKLTRILKQSLMGNSITRLIVTCSVSEETMEQTISSIKFAQRAQKVQTQASIAYNMNKFKGSKEQSHRLLKQSLDWAQSKIGEINQIVSGQESECRNCEKIKQVLRRRKEIRAAQEMFRVNPIEEFKSPKAKIDLRQFFSTGSLQKYSSVKSRYKNVKSNVLRGGFLFGREQKLPQYNQFMNRRMFELKNQNQKLRQDRNILQNRIQILEEMVKEGKDSKGDKNQGNKKVIRLAQDRVLRNITNSTNNNSINKEIIKLFKKTVPKVTQQHILSSKQKYNVLAENKNRDTDMTEVLFQINKVVAKLQIAADQYSRAILPLQTEILTQQVVYLQRRLIQKVGVNVSALSVNRICQFTLQLKRKLLLLFREMVDSYKKVFQLSVNHQNQEVSQILRHKCQQISEIKLNLQEFVEQNSQSIELKSFLQKVKSLNIKYKETESDSQLLTEQNQFLDMQGCPFATVVPQSQQVG